MPWRLWRRTARPFQSRDCVDHPCNAVAEWETPPFGARPLLAFGKLLRLSTPLTLLCLDHLCMEGGCRIQEVTQNDPIDLGPVDVQSPLWHKMIKLLIFQTTAH